MGESEIKMCQNSADQNIDSQDQMPPTTTPGTPRNEVGMLDKGIDPNLTQSNTSNWPLPIIRESGPISKEEYDSLKGLPGFNGMVFNSSEVFDGDLVEAFYPKVRNIPNSVKLMFGGRNMCKSFQSRFPKDALLKVMDR